MLHKVKKWFGIEGLKIALILDEKYDRDSGEIDGVIELMSMNNEEIKDIEVKLIERYSRGRGKSKLIDEYVMGVEKIYGPIYVDTNEIKEIEFTLPFQEQVSEMDMLERKNFLFSGFAKVAKFAKKAQSTYRVEVKANVKGTKFNPFAKLDIKFE